MRHRITSFRCVEAEENDDSCAAEVQDLYSREFSANSLPSRDPADQARQSSNTCAASGPGGTTSGGWLATVNPTRPRLFASPSSSGSYAPTSIVTLPVAALKLEGTLRDSELVQILRNGAATIAALAIVTRRVA